LKRAARTTHAEKTGSRTMKVVPTDLRLETDVSSVQLDAAFTMSSQAGAGRLAHVGRAVKRLERRA